VFVSGIRCLDDFAGVPDVLALRRRWMTALQVQEGAVGVGDAAALKSTAPSRVDSIDALRGLPTSKDAVEIYGGSGTCDLKPGLMNCTRSN